MGELIAKEKHTIAWQTTIIANNTTLLQISYTTSISNNNNYKQQVFQTATIVDIFVHYHPFYLVWIQIQQSK